MTQLILYNVFNGLIIGAFYGLMALGLSLILNLSGVINFAHGGFLAIGAYLAFMLMPFVGFWGALVIAPILTAIFGCIIERWLIRPLYGRDPLYSLLLTFGLAFMIEDGTRFIWGPQTLPFAIPDWLSSPLSSEFFFLTGYRLFMVVLVTLTVVVLFVILNHTRVGMRIRAGTLDLETVSVLGVNVRNPPQPEFRAGHLYGRARRCSRGRDARAAADNRQRAHHAELRRHHCRRPWKPAGNPGRRSVDRRRVGAHQRVLSLRQRSGDLCHDGACSSGAPARAFR